MKTKRYILRIEKPCSEDWSRMTPVEAGKFCSHCSKTVVDFTSLSDQQIIDYLQKQKTMPCLRLTEFQQDRLLVPVQERKNTPALYKFLSGLLLFGSVQDSFASTKTVPTEVVEGLDRRPSPGQEGMIPADTRIKVVLQDKTTGETIPFSNVVVLKDSVEVAVATTNMDGEAFFRLLEPGKYTVRAMYVGYQGVEVRDVLVTEEKTAFLLIQLATGPGVKLDEVQVIPYEAVAEPESVPLTREQYDILSLQPRVTMGIPAGSYQDYQAEAILAAKAAPEPKPKKWWQFWKR